MNWNRYGQTIPPAECVLLHVSCVFNMYLVSKKWASSLSFGDLRKCADPYL